MQGEYESMSVDKKKNEEHIRGILIAIGENPDREGLLETPSRVAKMYEEIFEGVGYTNGQIAEMFGKTFEEDIFIPKSSKEMVLMKDIEIFSYCEHHMALMYNMKVAIAYIPNEKILGLSKIARIADMVGKRLQLQERIGSDIAEIMQKVTVSESIAVLIQGQHACMTARGIKNTSAVTTTITLRGKFDTDSDLMDKFIMLCKQ
jgi:GTP cyclohydrolase IA